MFKTPTPLPSAGKQKMQVSLKKKKKKVVINHEVSRLEKEAWLEVEHLQGPWLQQVTCLHHASGDTASSQSTSPSASSISSTEKYYCSLFN